MILFQTRGVQLNMAFLTCHTTLGMLCPTFQNKYTKELLNQSSSKKIEQHPEQEQYSSRRDNDAKSERRESIYQNGLGQNARKFSIF